MDKLRSRTLAIGTFPPPTPCSDRDAKTEVEGGPAARPCSAASPPFHQNAIEADAFTVRGAPCSTAGAKTSKAEAQ